MHERHKVTKWKITRTGKDSTNEIWSGWSECFRFWTPLIIFCINTCISCVLFFLHVGLHCLNVSVVLRCGRLETLCQWEKKDGREVMEHVEWLDWQGKCLQCTVHLKLYEISVICFWSRWQFSNYKYFTLIMWCNVVLNAIYNY